jgi:hypothetical protein
MSTKQLSTIHFYPFSVWTGSQSTAIMFIKLVGIFMGTRGQQRVMPEHGSTDATFDFA